MNNLFIILTYSINNTGHHSIHVESAQTAIELLMDSREEKKAFGTPHASIILAITSGVESYEIDSGIFFYAV